MATYPLPGRRARVARLPGSAYRAKLPGKVVLLPPGLVPRIPPKIEVVATGTGSALVHLEAVLLVDVTAHGSGLALADLTQVYSVTAEPGGEGTALVDVYPLEDLEVIATVSGTASADLEGYYGVDALATGTGTALIDIEIDAVGQTLGTAVVIPEIDALASGSGTASATLTQVYAIEALGTVSGSALADLVVFVPMRMNKNANQTLSNAGWNMVTGWTADAAYPGTQIVANQLKMSGAGTGKTVTAVVSYSTSFANIHSAQLYKNNVAQGTAQTMTATSGTLTFSLTGQTITNDDLWDLRVNTGNTSFPPTVNATGTYLRVE